MANTHEELDEWPTTESHVSAVRRPTPLPTPIQRSKVVATVPLPKVIIEQDITCLADLIRIIDTHPYVPGTQSNINLEALHNIGPELRQIHAMIGLKTFKDSLLDQLLYFMQGLHINREQDFKHMVIYGPPGSGKTQAAKLIGTMYSKLDILKNGIFRKVTRNDLVAGYLGQTTIKTSKVIQECLGGCLFIDEVYSLGCGGEDGGDSFSKECIDTLCEALSDYKNELMVIVAGYEKDVKECFFGMNPGLASRFIWRFTVEEYTPEELMRIFLQKVEQNGWTFEEGSGCFAAATEAWFKSHKKDFVHFGRDMELLFTYTKIAHGRRIYGKSEDLRRKLTMTDLTQGHKQFLNHGEKKAPSLPESCYGLYL